MPEPKEKHVVSQGETIPSIALDTGFYWKTLWNDSNNSDLKNKRKNPNVLFAGDEVYVPDITPKSVSRPTEARHKFRRKGDPVKIVILLRRADKARANEAYTMEIEGKTYKGNTDGDGKITQKVPGDATTATLYLNDGKEVRIVRIGSLDPVDTVTGVQQRLINQGFVCDETGDLDDDTVRALQKFQSKSNLTVSGEIDQPTKDKLMDLSQ